MQARIENITAQSIVYMRQIGPYGGAQNFQLMENMKQWIRNQNLWNETGIIYGIAQDDATVTPPEKCRYDVCFVTETDFQDNTIRHGKLPHGAYLVFEVLHTADDVKHFWETIGDILAQEKRQIDENRPVLERYQIGLVEKGYCEFCIPILS
ncbi:GyrI-like domain-containing protein [Lachnospiraceae bacterium ZAX-1]